MPRMILVLHAKTADRFSCTLYDGKNKYTYDGYPPYFLGNGDGVTLTIDLDTGQIQNWKRPTEEEIERLTKGG